LVWITFVDSRFTFSKTTTCKIRLQEENPKMQLKDILAASLIALPSVLALGHAAIENKCSYPVYAWSVVPHSSSDRITINPGQTYKEGLKVPCRGCGVSLKISKEANSQAAITQFEYSITDGQIWYDISLIDCARGEDASACPGHEKGISLGGNMLCPKTFVCRPGEYCPGEAYYVPVPGVEQPVNACAKNQLEGEMRMVLCAERYQ
jgi:hypothetical protein